jgi:hypothetical protein
MEVGSDVKTIKRNYLMLFVQRRRTCLFTIINKFKLFLIRLSPGFTCAADTYSSDKKFLDTQKTGSTSQPEQNSAF